MTTSSSTSSPGGRTCRSSSLSASPRFGALGGDLWRGEGRELGRARLLYAWSLAGFPPETIMRLVDQKALSITFLDSPGVLGARSTRSPVSRTSLRSAPFPERSWSGCMSPSGSNPQAPRTGQEKVTSRCLTSWSCSGASACLTKRSFVCSASMPTQCAGLRKQRQSSTKRTSKSAFGRPAGPSES